MVKKQEKRRREMRDSYSEGKVTGWKNMYHTYWYIVLRKCKVKLSLCLTKHHAMKAYWGVEV
jgi:hypothetical protein